MTTEDHVNRVRKLAAQAMAWEGQDTAPPAVCHCRTCGTVTQLLRGSLVSRGWSREASRRVTTAPPTEAASYPYLASVRVDGREVYRVHEDLAETLDPAILDDVEAALRRVSC